jgi:integrase
VKRQLEAEVFPELGDMLLTEIRPSDIRPIINGMQERGAVDQAHRTLLRISRTFQLATVNEEVEADPAAALTAILWPVPKRKYPAILQVDAARAALRALEAEPHQPTTKLASRLLALTAARPGPLRFAKPSEFHDLDGSDPRWVIPADKMKLERAESEQAAFEFTIPLSRQAVATVKAALEHCDGRDFLFPSLQYATRPISENALSVAYKRCPAMLGRHVPHGWRSTFSTVMNERAAELDRPGDRAIIDLMLAHKPKGVEAHYNRAAYMSRRRLLAQEWADLLCGTGPTALVPPEKLLKGPRH